MGQFHHSVVATNKSTTGLQCARGYNCGEKAFENLVELEMSIKEQVCVTLEYELSAVPSEPFTLFIEGFSHSRKAIAVPPISFHKASHIDWYGFGNDF